MNLFDKVHKARTEQQQPPPPGNTGETPHSEDEAAEQGQGEDEKKP